MEKITEKKAVKNLILLFTFMYLVSYLTRLNYGTVIAEIVAAEGIKKSLASLALTGSAVTYGFGQLVSGFFGDRIQPKKLVLCGLVTTLLTNLAIPFCSSPYQMTAVWCVNGLAQSFMWPPLVKIMTEIFTAQTYKRACVIVSWGSSFGTMLIYLLSPLIIHLAGWKAVFVFSAVTALAMIIFWAAKCPLIEIKRINKGHVLEAQTKSRYPVWLFGIVIAILLQGALRDGVTTWLPSCVSETFNLSREVSILSGVVLPIFTIISFRVVSAINEKKVKNEVLLAAILFFAGFAAAFCLGVANGASAALTVALSAVLCGCMHGVNLMLICMLPPYFRRYGKVSFVSGFLNSCTYVGSAASTYGIAVFSESFGWTATIFLWSAIALAGGLTCLTLVKKWRSFAAAE